MSGAPTPLPQPCQRRPAMTPSVLVPARTPAVPLTSRPFRPMWSRTGASRAGTTSLRRNTSHTLNKKGK
jgi:hypothetical protein